MSNFQNLSADERERLHAAIAEAESRTHARFVLSVVPASDRYLLFPLLWGALLALLAGGLLAVFWPALPLRYAFSIEAAIFVGLSLLLDWLPLRLLLVPPHIKRAHAHNLAHREFAARILANPEHHDGILFFVSLGERHVQVLGGRDLHTRVDEADWNRIVADFIAEVKAGRISDGVLAAIRSCGTILERHYPVKNASTGS